MLNIQDLEELPVDIGVFRSVVGISAIKNRLCTLPESIGHLERLERLDLRFNRIQRLPASMARLTSLTIINLADNELSEIPDWVHRLPALRSFFIPGRRQRVPEAQKRQLRAARPEIEIDHDFVPPFTTI